MKKICTYFFTLVSLMALVTVTVHHPKVSAAFDPNNIMTDSVFDNTNTMSKADIDNFLNKYPSSCISTNHGIPWSEPIGYSPSTGYQYGGLVSAGTVIYNVSQVYGINPQVIIATLQKESSVVTGTASYGCQYIDTSMGYDCPDAGACPGNPATESGFPKQVVHAAWLLKFGEQRAEGKTGWNVQISNFPHNGNVWNNSDDPPTCYGGSMTAGYRARSTSTNKCPTSTSPPGNQSVYYDGTTTIDGSTVQIASGATAGFYYYTPHFSGNQHLVNLFENTFGFGSTTTGLLDIAHPDGTLVRPAAGPNASHVYLLKDGGAAYATSLGVFQSWGLDFSQVKVASQGDLNLMAASDADTSHTHNPAPLTYRFGTLLKGSDPTVYVVDNVNGLNTIRSLGDLQNFIRLGYNFNQVITVPDNELPAQIGPDITMSTATHVDGTLVRDSNSPTVYYIIGGERHSMTSLNIFLSNHFKFNQVQIATAGDDQLPITWPVNWYGEGTLIKGSAPTVYVVDLDSSGVTQSKRSIGTYYNFTGLDYKFKDVMQVSDSELPGSDGQPIGQ